MFGLESVTWSEFLIFDAVLCIVLDVILVVFATMMLKKGSQMSTDSIRRKRSRKEDVEDEEWSVTEFSS